MRESNEVICKLLEDRANELGRLRASDVMFFYGPLLDGADDQIRTAIEASPPSETRKLTILVETGGGYIQVVERIVATIRHFYDHVDFFIPNKAMSAGTVLVMSGDSIWMDYYSVLGPIDPQIEKDNRLIPALGYLTQFARLIDKSRSTEGLSPAETLYLIQKFDPAELDFIENDRDLSVELLKDWLVRYKFKNWLITTSGNPVTPEMRASRAEEIGKKLNSNTFWHSHGRGIGMDRLCSDDVKLKIDDFGKDTELNKAVGDYYHLVIDHIRKNGLSMFVHTAGKLIRIPLQEFQ